MSEAASDSKKRRAGSRTSSAIDSTDVKRQLVVSTPNTEVTHGGEGTHGSTSEALTALTAESTTLGMDVKHATHDIES